MADNPLVLNPESEFEAALIEIVRTHRKKSVGYGSETDPLQNFYDAAQFGGTTALREAEAFCRKHLAALKKWWTTAPVDQDPPPTRFSDDAFLDRAVYGVIMLVLYRRGR